MEATHRLKELLQLQLASDPYAVLHLPFVLDTLTRDDFLPSPHTQKWIARINSLIHSKDSAARWCGLCLAFQTAIYSKDIMLECAQSWVSTAMSLVVNQSHPTARAAIRLLRLIFVNAMDVPEFQRQICIPNVPKFVNALINIAQQANNSEVFLPAVDTLTQTVSLYPSLCRPLHNTLSNIALHHLNGSTPHSTSIARVEACARLYAALPLTGGKVNAPIMWRKSMDDTIAFAWGAFLQLRTTFSDNGSLGKIGQSTSSGEDPIIAIPLALDRLRAAVQVITHVLRTNATRPTSLPIGSLIRLCSSLLQCSLDDKSEKYVDSARHALERSVVPVLWSLSSEMLTSLSQAGQHHLTPHLPTLLAYLAYHLEQGHSPRHTLQFLCAALSLVGNGSRLHNDVIASRLTRATMPLLTVILSKPSQTSGEDQQASAAGRVKKGKKRARNYEGDEVFKLGREIVCPTAEEGDVLLASVTLLERLVLRTQVTPPVLSIASRLLLSIYASLPALPPLVLSSDLSLHPRLYAMLQRVCVSLAMGTTNTMSSKSLPVVLSLADGTSGENSDLTVDLLIHPRMPPLVRSLPHVEKLSLFRAEESREETDTRKQVGLTVADERELRQPSIPRSLTPPQGSTQTRLSSASQISLETGPTSGLHAAQQPGSGDMQVEVPSFTPLAFPLHDSDSPTWSSTPVLQTAAVDLTSRTSLPPPPDRIPSTPSVVVPTPAAPVACGEEDDEPMPAIDLGSDSEGE